MAGTAKTIQGAYFILGGITVSLTLWDDEHFRPELLTFSFATLCFYVDFGMMTANNTPVCRLCLQLRSRC
jgi:hypothetical protein